MDGGDNVRPLQVQPGQSLLGGFELPRAKDTGVNHDPPMHRRSSRNQYATAAPQTMARSPDGPLHHKTGGG